MEEQQTTQTRSATASDTHKRKRDKGFYILGGILLLGTVIAVGAWRPVVDLWNVVTQDRSQLWGNVWVDNENWVSQDERQERPGMLSGVNLDGFQTTISPRDARLTQCWRGNGQVIASVETLTPTGDLPIGRLQITVTPDEWPQGIPASKEEQQKDRTHVPTQTTGHAALNYTSTDGTLRYSAQLANDHATGDVVTYKDNKWTIKAGFFSPVNSTVNLNKLEATLSCPEGR